MNKILKAILCTYCIISVGYATPPSCLELHQSQLNTLNERMNQMLSALYSSPILSKLKSVTNPESSPEGTAAVEESPEAVSAHYDTSAYYAPSSTGVTPQIVYLPAASTLPSEGSTRTARSYYQPDVPLEYLMSPWSQYYDPYHTTLSPSYPSTLLQNPLATSYASYSDYYSPVPYGPYIPPTYPTIPPPAYPTISPPTYPTPPPTYQTPPPVYQTLPANKPLPQTYQPAPQYKSPLPVYPSPPPPYQTPLPSYQNPPLTYPAPSSLYQTPPPAYNSPPPAYNTPPPVYSPSSPIYSPSSPITPYSPVRYSRAVEYGPY